MAQKFRVREARIKSESSNRSGLITENMTSSTADKLVGTTFKSVLVNENGEFVVGPENSVLGDAVGSVKTLIGANTPIKVSTDPTQVGVLTDGTSIIVPMSGKEIIDMTSASLPGIINQPATPTVSNTGFNGSYDNYVTSRAITLDNTPSYIPAGKTKWKIVGNVKAEFRVVSPNSAGIFRLRGDINGVGSPVAIGSDNYSNLITALDTWLTIPINIDAAGVSGANTLNVITETIVDAGVSIFNVGGYANTLEVYFEGQFVAV